MSDDPLGIFFEDEDGNDVTQQNHQAEEVEYGNDELYKKWFRGKDKSGFLGVRSALKIGKLAVDIGEASGTKLTGATLVYTNAIPFAVYLRAVASGIGDKLFPATTYKGKTTPAETFTYYGGANKDGKPVSRILKVAYWNDDPSAFQFKTGHFEANVGKTGAFMPRMDKPISLNFIKVTRPELAEISYRVDLALTAHAAGQNAGEILHVLSGGSRK